MSESARMGGFYSREFSPTAAGGFACGQIVSEIRGPSAFAFRLSSTVKSIHCEDMDAYQKARELIDAAHSADPVRTHDGAAAELLYADRIEHWVVRLDEQSTPILRLAARCQHLERWLVPRASFPLDKPGYLAWRRSLYVKQAEKARELLRQAGVADNESTEVFTWVSKAGLKTNPGTQSLEDAACLVFLENEIEAFAAQHADYAREKFVDIIRKTWRKMSPAAQQLALGLQLSPPIEALVLAAIQ